MKHRGMKEENRCPIFRPFRSQIRAWLPTTGLNLVSEETRLIVHQELYINATRFHSAKETACRGRNGLTHRFQQDWSVLATHSTGRYRNPRRNSGLTYTGVSYTRPGQTGWDSPNVDPVVDACVVYDGKGRGYEVVPSVSRVSSIPPSEFGEPSFHHELETTSNFSWNAVSDNLSVFSKRAGKISSPPTPTTPSITSWTGT
ncbi:hypothetical protein BJ322DRAFT_1017014 [Thelephora terrestris]|uniref:Uncharacterized protein n=1 Tax=Thelephora terrestris TaxID=56493 RepID=A0A9P6LDR5_9AGAM|nr:hypothetical protein BJ322DRAFT_1017014 [Thelephora terrestris]